MGDVIHTTDGGGHVREHGFRSHHSEHHKKLMKKIEDVEGSVGKHLEVRQAEHCLLCLLMQSKADCT